MRRGSLRCRREKQSEVTGIHPSEINHVSGRGQLGLRPGAKLIISVPRYQFRSITLRGWEQAG